MIEIAIVISACRRSWPWFQRRKSCCIDSPMPATTSVPTTAGTIQCVRFTCELDSPNDAATLDHVPLHLQRDVAAEQEERAVRHVDDAHQPEDQREAARDDEVERRGGDAVQERDQEVLRVVHRRPERRRPLPRRRREEQHPEGGYEDDHREQAEAERLGARAFCAANARALPPLKRWHADGLAHTGAGSR